MDDKKIDLIDIAKKKRHMALIEKLSRGTTLTQKEVKELEGFEKAIKKPHEAVIAGTVDLETISVFMDKSTRTVWRYIDHGMPVIRDSAGEVFRFRVNDVFKWLYGSKGVDKEGKGFWDNEYRKNRAKLSEIELKQKEGELIPFDDHISIIKNQVRGIKAGFLRLPKHVAPKLYQQEPKVICEMLDQEIRFIINQFAGVQSANKTGKGSN